MTVSSLWKVLDNAGCGKQVGAREIANGERSVAPRNLLDWNHKGHVQHPVSTVTNRTALAVDLSIWICEALTSHAAENHANPALHLVFTRTMKLLSLGIKLVFVVEGKRRIRCEPGEEEKFRKRRSGTAFWNSCRGCQQMLGLLGIPVVCAKAEGEALCALLNQRGIVDGVISNDGDCLLFGARTIYTKFSIENLENSTVMRYDLDDLFAVVDTKDNTELQQQKIQLSREDLVAFALLTGSDMAGPGLADVGHKKAIRFITKCKTDFPLTKDLAAINELKSWARTAATEPIQDDAEDTKEHRCCTRCSHAGTKRHHEKHGCTICGTEPGEPCNEFTKEDRFRKALRAKALAVRPPFEPSQVLNGYLRPNENQMPLQLARVTSETLVMKTPQLAEILKAPVIITGRNLDSSRTYVKKMLTRIMARNELFCNDNPATEQNGDAVQRLSRERPVAKRITKMIVKNRVPCYEVEWQVNATLTDEQGEGVDGYEFSTVEPRDLIEKRFPHLLSTFETAEKERQQQGDAEQLRRQAFLDQLIEGPREAEIEKLKKQRAKEMKKREEFFNQKSNRLYKKERPKRRMRNDRHKVSCDILNLLGARGSSMQNRKDKKHSKASRRRRSKSTKLKCMLQLPQSPVETKAGRSIVWSSPSFQPEQEFPSCPPSPAASGIYCQMGDLLVPVSPIVSNQGQFPPKHIIFAHINWAPSSPLI